MSDERRRDERPHIGEEKGEDENRALTEWTSEEELEREREESGTGETPKLGNPPG